MEKLAYVIAGWVLGIAQTLIVDAFNRRRRRIEVRAALRAELEDLRYRLATASYLLLSKQGRLDKSFLTWVLPIIENYKGNEPSEAALKSTKGLASLNEAEILALAQQVKSKEGVAFNLKTIPATFLEAHLAEIARMPVSTQTKIHEFRNQLHLINEEIPRLDSMMMLTFNSGLSDRNHEVVTAEVKNKTAFIQERYKLAADKISAILWDL